MVPRPLPLGLFLVPLALLLPGAREVAVQDLPRVSPEAVGWSLEGLEEASEMAEGMGFTALIMAQDGKVFFEWGRTRRNYRLHSIRKPLVGGLYGIYEAEGVIDLDWTLEELGIDDRSPRLTPEEKRATVLHLLQSRSGVYHPAAAETRDMRATRPRRGSHRPGEHFYYNNWDFNVLGTIFREVTGEDVFEAFKERIADPIGMQDFDPDGCEYNYHSSSDHPQYSFRMSARDLLRFGILYQQRGAWNGTAVVPERWIERSTFDEHGSVDARSGAGFGYLWGLMPEGSAVAEASGGAGFMFSGYGGHYLAVIPELKLVYVLRTDTDGPIRTPTGVGDLLRKIRDARVDRGNQG